MISVILALLAALAWSLAVVFARKKIVESNYLSLSFVVAIIGNGILWPIALIFTNFETFNMYALFFFVVAGIFAPGFSRIIYFKGMETIGASVNASIYATYPMYSSIFAVLFLRETLILENWLGILCLISGVFLIEREVPPNHGNTGFFIKDKTGIIFPLSAAVLVASSAVIKKFGLNLYNEPLFGLVIGQFTTLLLYLFLVISSKNMRTSISRKSFSLFWQTAILIAIAGVLSIYALSYGTVSLVTPLEQTMPLFVVLFSYIFLKEVEQPSFSLILSTLIIVVGAILVSIR